jgi:hypothetical protein
MKIRLASVMAGVATLATTGAVLLVGATAANAATPPFQPPNATADPNEVGTLALFNASGAQITHGSLTDAPLAAYYVASTADAGHTKATQYFYTPKNGTAQGAWPGEQASLSTTYPNASAPAPINGEGSNPVVTGAGSDESLQTYIADDPNTDTSADGYANLYEIRVKTSSNGTYWAADILVSGSTWSEVYGTAIGTTTSTPTSTANPSNQGSPVTFATKVTGADGSTPPDGTVQFFNGSATLGAAQSLSGTGTASVTTSSLTAAGSPYNITAVYTPSSNTTFPTYGASTSAALSQVVNPPATPTTTTLSISGNADTGTTATLSGTVSPAAAAGTVQFFDGSSSTPIPVDGGPTVTVTSGAYTATLTGGFAAGPHSVVAKFTPSSPAVYAASQSAPVGFTTATAGGTCAQASSSCTDVQPIQAEIPTGMLVISTPYNAANPLDLGNLALNPTGSAWTGNKTFRCITVTDTNGVNTGFNALAQASALNLAAGGPTPPAGAYTSINGENVGLTHLVPSTATCPVTGATPVNSYTGAGVTGTDNAAASPPVAPTDGGFQGLGNEPHTVLTGSANGVGTATYDGTLTLNAPTSTAAGTYQGTITFTVSDGE